MGQNVPRAPGRTGLTRPGRPIFVQHGGARPATPAEMANTLRNFPQPVQQSAGTTVIVAGSGSSGSPGPAQLSGDVNGPANANTLGPTGVAAGSYGDAADIPAFVVGADGRLQSVSVVAVQIAEAQVTGLPADLAARVQLGGDLDGGTAESPVVTGIQGNPIASGTPSSGQTIVWNGSVFAFQTPGAGVTSVGVSVPPWMSVSGSPVTSTGTIGISANVQSANTFLAGPSSGVGAAPGFRTLSGADFPASGVGAGSYGDSAHVAQITVGADGRITSAGNVAVAPGAASLTVQGFTY